MGTIWMYDDPAAGYHAWNCPCPRHCGYCLEDLDEIRAVQQRMIDEHSPAAPEKPLDVRARYCSRHCQRQAAAGRAFDRRLAAAPVKES